MRIRLHIKLKSNNYAELCMVDEPRLEKIKVYARGWLNYYGIASMKNNIDDINGWLYHRICTYTKGQLRPFDDRWHLSSCQV